MAIHLYKKQQTLIRKKDKKQIFLGRKRKTVRNEKKKALKSVSRLEVLDQILNQEPKIINLNQKSDFELLYPRKVKKSIKDIVLSGEWMNQNTPMMANSREMFLLLVGQLVKKNICAECGQIQFIW